MYFNAINGLCVKSAPIPVITVSPESKVPVLIGGKPVLAPKSIIFLRLFSAECDRLYLSGVSFKNFFHA